MISFLRKIFFKQKSKGSLVNITGESQVKLKKIEDYILGEFTDIRDNKKYRTIEFKDKIWLLDNFSFEIENSWFYENDSQNHAIGRLYTYDAAEKACPENWRIPTIEEIRELMLEFWECKTVNIEYDSGGVFFQRSIDESCIIENKDDFFINKLSGLKNEEGLLNVNGLFIIAANRLDDHFSKLDKNFALKDMHSSFWSKTIDNSSELNSNFVLSCSKYENILIVQSSVSWSVNSGLSCRYVRNKN